MSFWKSHLREEEKIWGVRNVCLWEGHEWKTDILYEEMRIELFQVTIPQSWVEIFVYSNYDKEHK